MTSAVSLGLLVLLEVQTYHNIYRSGTNRSRFLVVFNILHYFVHERLLVPFSLGVLLSCMFVCLCLLPTVLQWLKCKIIGGGTLHSGLGP